MSDGEYPELMVPKSVRQKMAAVMARFPDVGPEEWVRQFKADPEVKRWLDFTDEQP